MIGLGTMGRNLLLNTGIRLQLQAKRPGLEIAEALIARDGFHWFVLTPTSKKQ